MSKADNILLEAFLAELESTLRDIPVDHRREVLDETRSHLEAMLAARRSDGFSENEAWQSVRWGFGEPKVIGDALAKQWRQAPHFSEAQNAESDRRTRAINFTIILWLAAFGFALNNVPLGVLSPGVLSIAIIGVIPFLAAFQTWCLYKGHVAITPSKIKAFALSCVVLFSLGIKLQCEGTSQAALVNQLGDVCFGSIVFMACSLMLAWEGREAKKKRI
ncbi:hypothetical protein EON83_20955 [bacterium]|nr:MAG: hypothetical protein EON83_20955 [bacterium]